MADRSAYANTILKVIKVFDGVSRDKLLGSVLIVIKTLHDGNTESVSVMASSLANVAATDYVASKLTLNRIEAVINHAESNITFGPSHGIHMETRMQNKGVGTFIFNELVTYLQRHAANYNVNTFEFSGDDDFSNEQQERTIAFLNKFNVHMKFNDGEQHVGFARSQPPQQMESYINPAKVQEIDIEKYIFELVSERNSYESELKQLRDDLSRKTDETFAGIPKSELIKYTLIACGVSVIFVLFMVI
ncbi:hypothetical protein RsTz2092_04210 [Deferribacterales bacterium RsTz2092]|nr:hypothetical protein AGMMS49941_01830 [Deferribacterales bacterium]